MQPRRSSALLAVITAFAVLGLSACGFGPATQVPYTPAAGANNREGEVDVLGAVVVAAQPGSGTFIASLANNSEDDAVTFEGISGAEGNAIVPGDFTPAEIEPRRLVNLAEEGGPTLAGDFIAGDFLPLTLSFGDGTTATLDVPVVTACGDYLGLDESTSETELEEAYSCEAEVEEEATADSAEDADAEDTESVEGTE